MSAATLKIGQILYRVKRQRRGEHNRREVESVTVATVRTKYFTLVEDGTDERYLKATLRHEDGYYDRLHLTAAEITDEWERGDLQRELASQFTYTVLPLDKLRQVEAILSPQAAAAL